MAKSVAETLRTLTVLQSVDDQLGELRENVAALSLRVDEHKKRVAALEAELTERSAQLKAEEKDSAKKELELKTIQDKIAKLRTQLNTLRDNKQYTAMMHEISGREAQGSRTEDQALQLMDQMEDTRAGIDDVKTQLEEARKVVRAEEAAVADEVRTLSGQIRELTAERRGLTEQLDRPVMDRYTRISHSKGGRAVVAVRDGVCQGCFMSLTKQQIAQLMTAKELIHCGNCSRIMYLDQADSASE